MSPSQSRLLKRLLRGIAVSSAIESLTSKTSWPRVSIPKLGFFEFLGKEGGDGEGEI
jgi:hypothetical protein